MTIRELVPFCIANRHYFDVPDRLADNNSRFNVSQRPIPADWIRQAIGLSIFLRPNSISLPQQGWKIHISVSPSDADELLEIVWAYCIQNSIAFKFLRSRAAVFANSSKYWSRSASGKVITIYPVHDEQFTSILQDLAPRLARFKGPYILTDLRYGDGPLYVRYGAFTKLWHVNEDGTRSLALQTPDQNYVVDRREPIFVVPDFVKAPRILEPYLRRSSEDEFDRFPYEIETALHFSNGGGVYLARDPTSGSRVVIREARQYAGLDSRGEDAVARLTNEYNMLSRLHGLACVPKVLGHHTVWEHQFLAEEYIDGSTLLDEIIRRYPLVHPKPNEADLADYMSWARGTFDHLEAALRKIHSRDVKVGDLHPSNIIVSPTGRVVIVDFEFGSQLSDLSPSRGGAPGFTGPSDLSAEDSDRYALECVRLMVLLPIVPLLNLDLRKRRTLVSVACAMLPVEMSLRQKLEHGLSLGSRGEADQDFAAAMFSESRLDWPSIRSSLANGILASAPPKPRRQPFALLLAHHFKRRIPGRRSGLWTP